MPRNIKDAAVMFYPDYQEDPSRHRNASRHEWLVFGSLVPSVTFNRLFQGVWAPSAGARRVVLLVEPFYKGDAKAEPDNIRLVRQTCTNFS
jgi:hypothetical protein